MREIEGKTAIVIGGAGGIGGATALALAREGVRVVAADINLEGSIGVADQINGDGGQAFALGVDVTDAAQVRHLMDETAGRFGSVDILVNSQGVGLRKLLVEYTEEEWDHIIDVNLKGTFLACQAAVKRMIPQRYGRIVNFASEAGIRHAPEHTPYGAAKAGIINFTRSLALEVAPYHVTVNAIAPGRTYTPMLIAARRPGELERELAAGKMGKPEEIAGLVLFLCSDWGKVITGQTVWRQVFLGLKPEDTYQFPY